MSNEGRLIVLTSRRMDEGDRRLDWSKGDCHVLAYETSDAYGLHN